MGGHGDTYERHRKNEAHPEAADHGDKLGIAFSRSGVARLKRHAAFGTCTGSRPYNFRIHGTDINRPGSRLRLPPDRSVKICLGRGGKFSCAGFAAEPVIGSPVPPGKPCSRDFHSADGIDAGQIRLVHGFANVRLLYQPAPSHRSGSAAPSGAPHPPASRRQWQHRVHRVSMPRRLRKPNRR